MTNYGVNVTLDDFLYSGKTYYNVVGEILGTTRPQDVYIIGAHFDSVNNPGADDNASGTAGVLEIARLISRWKCDATIRLIAFDREEQGLIGSDAYANQFKNDLIRGMISLDMIAYSTAPNLRKVMLYGRSASNELLLPLKDAMLNYANITATLGGQLDASDHAPFEWRGFDAGLVIEYDVWSNPYYHTQNDSVDSPNYINYNYAIDLLKGTLGWLVDAAGIHPVAFYYPDGVRTVKGTFLSGTLQSFMADDGDYWVQSAQYDPTDPTAFLNSMLTTDTHVGAFTFASGHVKTVQKSNTTNTVYRLRALKNSGNFYTVADNVQSSFSDVAVEGDLPSPISDFVDGTQGNRMRLELRNATANRLAGFFTHYTDLVEWSLSP